MRRSLNAGFAVLAVLAATASGADIAANAQQASPAAAALEAWIEVYNRQDLAAMEAFAQERYQAAWLAQSPAHQLAIGYRNWFADYGGFRLISSVTRSPLAAEALVYSPTLDACHGVFVDLDRAAPERIEGVYLAPFTGRACPESAGPDQWSQFPDALRAYLDGLAATDRFDGVVLVRRNAHTIVHEARGRRSLAPPRGNGLQTRFELASVSKLFTAVAVARLVEEGRISFDDTVAGLMPQYPDRANAARITVRHLLSHTSGIEDYYRTGAIFADPRARSSFEDYWPLFAGRPLPFDPGARYDYSNANYVLLGSIVEQVSGERFEDFVDREVFERADMTSACYCPPGARGAAAPLTVYTAVAGPARRVSAEGLRQVPRDAPRPALSAGYAMASARDMTRFGEGLISGRLLSRSMLERMMTAQASMDDGGVKGLGFEVYDIDGMRVAGHGGSSWGVRTQLDIYPEANVVVVILSNRDASGAAALRHKTRRWITRLAAR